MNWKKYKRLRRYRQMGLTQKETAKLLDIGERTVQEYEALPRKYDLQLLKGGAA
jgi:transcriptional regulator with XRE-family HTH domain